MKRKGRDLFRRLEKYPVGRTAQNMLPDILKGIDSLRKEKVWELSDTWKALLGTPSAEMTEILKFQEGILYVKVASAILYSELSMQKKGLLLKKLQDSLPQMGIKNIVFRR